MKRTKYCGAFCEADVGMEATVMGWVQTKRDMGGVIFLDLRDREGTLQVVLSQQNLPESSFKQAETLKPESVISATGRIFIRDEETYNPRLRTGTIELRAAALTVLSEAQTLPFSVSNDAAAVREDLRLRYRFLDLRRPQMLYNLKFRHLVQKVAQDYLDAEGFVCVETPMLTKSTPEGARDYLVPSRVHPGSFYALPQSPQIFKQLLMVGGIDKYYQVARCFRDEDLRADRQPEFTQVDMEMSFVDQEDILAHLEQMFAHLFASVMGRPAETPFPRITWTEAMDRYGSDKPDIRFGLPIVDLTDIARQCSFSVFRSVTQKGGVVRAINAKGCASFTRTVIEELTAKAQSYGARGMAWIAIREDGSLYSILTKYFKKKEMDEIIAAMDGKPGDFILFCADGLKTVRRVLGNLRLDLGDMLGLRPKDQYRFLMVTDFPQFEYSEEEKRYVATHHPFTMPYPEDIPYLKSDPARVRTQAYDVVLNGVELGSGSIRIHQKDVQRQMFEALGFTEKQIEDRFGFMVHAFQYGTPPHGGFAFGLDRLVMLLLGADSLREVIAFPKVKDASCLMTNAPDAVDPQQLEILGISTGREENTGTSVSAGNKTTRQKTAAQIDVQNVAALSKLYLSEQEQIEMKTQLSTIIGFADQLSALDVEGIEPTAHVLPVQNVFREDASPQSFPREELLQNTPSVKDGYIYVPRVVE